MRVQGHTIDQFTDLSAGEAARAIAKLRFKGREHTVAAGLIPEIQQRLRFMETVGLGYLALGRSAKTLSGGESQRIRLAAQLGSNLRGVLYVLDEPTIGLDVVARAKIRALIRELNVEEKLTVFLTSHDVRDIETLSSRVVIIHHGRCLMDTSVKSLKRDHLRTRRVVLTLREPLPVSTRWAVPTSLQCHRLTSSTALLRSSVVSRP